MTTTTPGTHSPAAGRRGALAVLASAREARARADAAEVQVLVDAVDWAVTNPPVFGRDAAALYVSEHDGQAPVREPLNADGVPQVDRAAVAEYGLALGCSTQSAQALIGDALELAYRLPTLWTRVVAGEVTAWRARRVAQATRALPRLGAGFVDRQIAPVAHRVGGPTLERLVATAMSRFDQQRALQIAEERREVRHVEIDLDNTTLGGITDVTGRIEMPDAEDLEAALAHAAAQLAAWGSDASLDVRRARALGDLARQHLTWNGQPTPTHRNQGIGAGAATTVRDPDHRVPPKRQIVLYLHLTDRAIHDGLSGCRDEESGIVPMHLGRVENTGTPVTAETIRTWCGDTNTSVSVRPVIDIAASLHADSYEIPARLREQIRLRDGTCIFPGCHAKALYCQDDHTDPYDHEHPTAGGQTETENLALLCQRHHTLKTHHGFSYTRLPSGATLWRTPHGLRIRTNPDGTTHVDGLPAASRDIDPETADDSGDTGDPGTPGQPGQPPEP